jgi:hypothetical protein
MINNSEKHKRRMPFKKVNTRFELSAQILQIEILQIPVKEMVNIR